MNKEFSIYLDLTRFVAALLVVIYHSNVRLIIADKLPLSTHGHAAVIVFFVLSGYVISHMTTTRETTPITYWASRLSRFYSLTIPTVLLCPLLDTCGESLAPQFYADRTTHGLAWLRIITSLTYLNEIWTVSIMSFSNVPYWSLCYEMWYYVLFAITTFMRGKARLALGISVAALLGPKIMLLAPIWLLGVVLHRHPTLARLPQWLGWALFLASWPLYGLFQRYGMTEYGSQLLLRLIGEQWHQQMTFSKFLLTDYLLALIIAANFIGFRTVAHRFAALLRPSENIVRWLAGYTFSLYILHQPLLQFYAAVFDGDPRGRLFYAQVMLATLLNSVIIGHFTEHKRHHLRRLLTTLMQTRTPLRTGSPT
ncbi:acyltransferase family protein [Duganella aceris]|uniref:Acyltransferase n=1 Tax=Duganella aceris TaxID=2703883 RepID=A0ABX0FTV3_9BURK|nr:acyltransferase [Duganella aceris]NGZ88120.1 acyltransferase [Duganella aceris]